MRQRVGLARALSVNARCCCWTSRFLRWTNRPAASSRKSAGTGKQRPTEDLHFVTHSIEEAVYVSDQIAILLPRPSRVSEIIRPSSFRDKSVNNIRRDPEYLDIVDRIWASLRSYVE